MPVMDEFKKEREALKDAPFSKKLEYFRDYYLMKTIVIVLVLAISGSFLYNFFFRKQIALYVTLVNFSLIQESAEGLTDPFAQENINTKKQEIFVDSSSYISSDQNEINFIKYGYEDEQRLFSMVMTGDMDLFISGKDVLERYSEQKWFDDLSTIEGGQELMKENEDGILVQNGIPIAVKLGDSSLLMKYYYYNGKQGEEVYAAFPTGSSHRDLAVKFLRYLMQ